jgi:hypothetical protein
MAPAGRGVTGMGLCGGKGSRSGLVIVEKPQVTHLFDDMRYTGATHVRRAQQTHVSAPTSAPTPLDSPSFILVGSILGPLISTLTRAPSGAVVHAGTERFSSRAEGDDVEVGAGRDEL